MNNVKKVKRVLICFSGIDGSGKTTLAYTLMRSLRNIGIQTKYVWGAHNILLLRPFLRFLKKKSNSNKTESKKQSHMSFIKKLVQNRFLSAVYQVWILLEYLLQILVKVRIPLAVGKNVVCDRYVYDTAINLAVNLHYSKERFKLILNGLLKICPKPNVIFFVDLPEEVAYQRKNDIPSKSYLAERRSFYNIVAKEYNMTILDGSENLKDLQQYMQSAMKTKLGLNVDYTNFAVNTVPSSKLLLIEP